MRCAAAESLFSGRIRRNIRPRGVKPKHEDRPGQEIEVEGVSDKGHYAPTVKAPVIRVLGKAQMPVPRQVSISLAFATAKEGKCRQPTHGAKRQRGRFGNHGNLNVVNNQLVTCAWETPRP